MITKGVDGIGSEDTVIFVVDDEPIIADVVERMLIRHGFRAVKFYDPISALESANSHVPNLLLSDFRMPGMDGLTLAVRIRQRNPACKVVIMSGYVHEASKHPDRGICDLVSKPVSISKLVDKVASTLQATRSNSANC